MNKTIIYILSLITLISCAHKKEVKQEKATVIALNTTERMQSMYKSKDYMRGINIGACTMKEIYTSIEKNPYNPIPTMMANVYCSCIEAIKEQDLGESYFEGQSLLAENKEIEKLCLDYTITQLKFPEFIQEIKDKKYPLKD